MTLREFEEAFRALGGEIQQVRRSGERRYSHPVIPGRHLTANGRRRDASRAIIGYGMRVERALLWVGVA